jgi:hypothetical protein
MRLKKLIFVFLLAHVLSGCATIGTGERTIIRAVSNFSAIAQRFPHFIVTSAVGHDRVTTVGSDGQPTAESQFTQNRTKAFENFTKYMLAKYGDASYSSAQLSVNVRDLGIIPALRSPVDEKSRQEILKVLIDSKLSQKEKLAQIQLINASLVNIPVTPLATTLRGYDSAGREIYYYYPALQIDFSADVLSSTALDRFSHLIMLIMIPDEDFRKGVRFLEFDPKASDIAEFARGELKQQSTLNAKGTYGLARGGKTTQTGEGDSAEATRGLNLGGELSYSLNETFTQLLKDSLEKRNVGIIEGGRGFLVQYRAFKNLLIGGTNVFDLLVEVPANSRDIGGESSQYYEAVPVIDTLKPEILLLGVVRHVYDRGMTGFFNRVPEIENDDVYEQVIVQMITDRVFWRFNNLPWIRPITAKIPTYKVSVITHEKDANFAIIDKSDGSQLAKGTGEKNDLSITSSSSPINAEIVFFPINHRGSDGRVTTLKPSTSSFQFTIPADSTDSRTFYISYHP